MRDAASLPIGTPEQQATALKGLRSGDWLDFRELWDDPASDLQGGDAWRMVSLFAVRVGVTAARAIKVAVEMGGSFPPDVVADVVATRGAQFAGEFGTRGLNGRRWLKADAATLRLLVARFDLPIPQNIQYLTRWFRTAALELALVTPRGDEAMPEPGTSEHRFAEHVENAVDLEIDPR
ncbi:MAG: hypothetical protein ACK5MR_12490 [Cumulibacter sp.]